MVNATPAQIRRAVGLRLKSWFDPYSQQALSYQKELTRRRDLLAEQERAIAKEEARLRKLSYKPTQRTLRRGQRGFIPRAGKYYDPSKRKYMMPRMMREQSIKRKRVSGFATIGRQRKEIFDIRRKLKPVPILTWAQFKKKYYRRAKRALRRERLSAGFQLSRGLWG